MGAGPMSAPPIFHPVDRQSWPMAQAFYYYTEMAPTTYSVTVCLDVTEMRSALKRRGLKFFPAYLYLVTRAVGALPELRMAVREGALGCWETLTPVYPVFHEEDKTTSLLWTEYGERFGDFYARYLEDAAAFRNDRGILTKKGAPPANSFVVSCIPWFSFQSFSLHNHGIKDYFLPSFEAGAFRQNGGRTSMPLSVTVHHATTEGVHLRVFFSRLRALMEQPDLWLDES